MRAKAAEFLDRAVSNNPSPLPPNPHKALTGELSPRKRLRKDPGPEGLHVLASSLLQDVFDSFFLKPFTFYLFIIFLVSGLSLVAKSEGYPSRSVQASRSGGLSCCGARVWACGPQELWLPAPEHRLNGCSTRA